MSASMRSAPAAAPIPLAAEQLAPQQLPPLALEKDPTLHELRRSNEATRVRIGSCTGTPREVLEALANDASVTVRAAVAMNARAPVQVDEQLARDGDERVRALLARKLATLVPGLSGSERGVLQQRAYDTLTMLVTDEASAVQSLGEPVHVVENTTPNLKITYPADLDLAEKLITL